MKKAEICAIIKACRENGVHNFQYGELKIDFSTPNQKPDTKISEPDGHTDQGFTENTDELEKQALEQFDDAFRDMEEENLAITDPLLWEERQLSLET